MAPLPPGLFSTTSGLGRSFSFSTAADSVRAKMSLPPPAPAWTMMVTGFSGKLPAAIALPAPTATNRPTKSKTNHLHTFFIFSLHHKIRTPPGFQDPHRVPPSNMAFHGTTDRLHSTILPVITPF